KCPDRLVIGLGQIVKEFLDVRVDRLADSVPPAAKMQHARTWNRHFRRDAAMRFQELEMVNHRMTGKSDLSHDAHCLGPGLDAVELNAVLGHEAFDAIEGFQKIEMPPRAAIFPVGRELEPDLLLSADDLLDFTVLDLAQRSGRNLAALAFPTRLFERRGTQQAADVIGAVRRLHSLPVSVLLAPDPRGSG